MAGREGKEEQPRRRDEYDMRIQLRIIATGAHTKRKPEELGTEEKAASSGAEGAIGDKGGRKDTTENVEANGAGSTGTRTGRRKERTIPEEQDQEDKE